MMPPAPAAEVPAPSRQLATVQTDGSVTLTWKNGDDIARTVVARFGPGQMPTAPTGPVAVGDALGAGTVVLVGLEEVFVDRTPPAVCGVVTYRFWSQASDGRWSTEPVLAELPAGATTRSPNEPVSQLAVRLDGAALVVSWTNPASSTGFFQTSLVRKVGAAPTSPTDGQPVLTTMATTFSEPVAPFAAGSTVFYAAFTCNACGRCRAMPISTSYAVPTVDAGVDAGAPADAGITVDAGGPDAGAVDAGLSDAGLPDGGALDAGPSDAGATDAGTPLDAGSLTPTAFTATLSPDGQRVVLSWLNASNTRVRVTRTLTEGTTTGAAVTVFEGTATMADERVDRLLPNVTPARVYTYRVVGCDATTCESTGPTAPLSLTLKQALRGGGYSIFWRHASADVCADRLTLCPTSTMTCAQAVANTSAADWWRTCQSDAPTCSTNARQLNTVAAPNETMAVRMWFQSNGVTVGRIATSEFCRCFETAQQFMFGPTLEYSQDLTYYVYEESLRCPKTVAMLNQTPTSGTNSGFVSHAGFTCPTLDSLAWGEAAVFKAQAPTTQTCTTIGSCASGEACVSGFCVRPLLIARVPALGTNAWATLP